MLSDLTLTNFKAFSKPSSIRLAPITLLFGQNSSGKTSILKSLYLLLQTMKYAEADVPLLFRARHGYTDLGSFAETCFNHDDQQLSIRIDVAIDKNVFAPTRIKEWLECSSIKKLGLELFFNLIESELVLESFALFANSSAEKLAEYSRKKPAPRVKGVEKSGDDQFACTFVNRAESYWKYGYDHTAQDLAYLEEQISEWQSAPKDDAESENVSKYLQLLGRLQEQSRDELKSSPTIHSYIEYQNDGRPDRAKLGRRWFLPGRAQPSYLNAKNLNALIYDDFGSTDEWIDHEDVKVDETSFEHLMQTLFIPHAFDPNEIVELVSSLIEDGLRSTSVIGPLREKPQRAYLFGGVTPEAVGFEGENMPDILYRRTELIKEVNRWLDQLDTGYEVSAISIPPYYEGMFQIRLKELMSDASMTVSLADVGFGVAQLLPIIVQALMGKNQTIVVEQPELHIHPSLQASIGRLLAENIKEPFRNRYIIETHSEHLILRLQRLVRTGEIRATDVSVNYIQRHREGSSIQELRLDDDGDFMDPWPGGFFPERLRELID